MPPTIQTTIRKRKTSTNMDTNRISKSSSRTVSISTPITLSSLTKTLLLTVIILQTILTSNHQHGCLGARTRLRNILDVKFNSECPLPLCNPSDPNKSAVNLFQVISSNPELTAKTNFIWSNIGGPPMVITTSSSQESKLLIDWNQLLNKKTADATNPTSTTSPPSLVENPSAFHFNVTQDAAIGLLIEKIILFDDTDKSGELTKEKSQVEIDWGQLNWDLASRTTYHKDEFLKTNLRLRPDHPYLNGNITIKLAIPRDHKADRQKEVPHLKLNSQSISVVIQVEGLQPRLPFKNTRLAMQFVVVVQSSTDQVSLDTESDSLISDEYTPGVFRIKSIQFRTKTSQSQESTVTEDPNPGVYAEINGQPITPAPRPLLANKEQLGFLYWKEVAYTDRRKILSRTIDVIDHAVTNETSLDYLPSISQPFYHYFKYKPQTGPKPDYKLYRFSLIFGKGDTTYSSTNFTDFSFVFGLGAAPQEQIFSFFVKIIIFVCFCLPLLVMLAGLGYLMLRRFRRNGDTELLLAAES